MRARGVSRCPTGYLPGMTETPEHAATQDVEGTDEAEATGRSDVEGGTLELEPVEGVEGVEGVAGADNDGDTREISAVE